MLAGKAFSTFGYNVMVLVIMNIILCLALVVLAKTKKL